MRTRQGFVSNSSTSSFVILGYALEHDGQDDFYEKLEDELDSIEGCKLIIGGESGFDACFGVGARWSDDSPQPYKSIPLGDLDAAREKIKAALVNHGYWSKKVEESFGLHYGMH